MGIDNILEYYIIAFIKLKQEKIVLVLRTKLKQLNANFQYNLMPNKTLNGQM